MHPDIFDSVIAEAMTLEENSYFIVVQSYSYQRKIYGNLPFVKELFSGGKMSFD